METEQNSINDSLTTLLIIKFFVLIYTYISLPIYYVLQQPWAVLQKARRVRARLEDPSDPYSSWIRNGNPPNHYLKECKTLPEAQQKSLLMNGADKPCLGYRQISAEQEIKVSSKVIKKWDLSDYQWLTFGEADQRITHISRGLLINGVKPKDTVLIFSETRLEWFLSAQAIARIGASITTLYATLGNEGLVHGINEVEVTHIITTEDLLPKLSKLENRIPKVKTIIYIELDYKKNVPVQFESEVDLVPFKQLERDGKVAPKNLTGIDPTEDDVALIQYTSGSTGVPKGVILTHKQILSCFNSISTLTHKAFEEPDKHTYLAYLPLSHALEFCAETFLFSSGVKIGYGTPFTMTNSGTALKEGVKGDINLLKPTFMASVPLILERIRKDIELNVAKKSPVFRQLFNFAINYKIVWMQKGYRTPIIDYFICNAIRSQIGGKLSYMLVGGAPLSPDTHQFLRACLNICLCQGYGSTELTASATSMDFEDLTCGLIGAPLFGLKVKLIDWEEGGYKVEDKPNSRGEAVVGGPNVAVGYYKLEELTKESFETIDGIRWFKTGDILEVNSDGLFRIIDRKKDFVKLQFGEYISLGKVESELINSRFVDNICVYGDSYQSYMIALIIPTQKALRELASELSVPETDNWDELCRNQQIIDYVLKDLQSFGLSVGLHKMEIPAKIKLCSEEWTTSNALVTPALKIRRKNIKDFYQTDINRLYNK